MSAIDIIKGLISNIKAHFKKDPFFLWCVFIFMVVNPTASFLMNGAWTDALLTIAIAYLISCILTTVLSYGRYVGYAVKVLFLFIVFLYTSLALFCLIKFGGALDPAIFETLLNTNPNEIKEFLQVFIPWWLPMLYFLVLIGVYSAHYLCLFKRKLRMNEWQFKAHFYLLTYIIIVMAFCPNKVKSQISQLGNWTIPFDNIAINLKDHEPEHFDLTETTTSHPEKIVLIIGESHAKGHTSLYGYEKETYPQLTQMHADRSLYVFNNVFSPATATVISFKFILNTRREHDYEKDWYLYPSIISILKSAGYDTSWFSNQDEVGLYDNMASSFAHICNHHTFNTSKERLDGNLIEMHQMSDSKEFVIYHLMGQHVDFSKRYPKSFDKFKAEDYAQSKYEKRDIVAQYDNACLYNDYVVSSIMQRYKEEDAIVIYFPDHGLDIFDSSPKYYGHARNHGMRFKAYGLNIPLFVYATDKFKLLHPSTIQSIESAQDKPFNTANMTYMLMDIAGYSFE